MRRRYWKVVQTEGAPVYVRDCNRFAVVPVDNCPAKDLCGALPRVGTFAMGTYAETRDAALLVDLP